MKKRAAPKRYHPTSLFDTLAEVIRWVQTWRNGDGCICPCCGQLVKVYKRFLHSGMVRSLIWMVRFSDGTIWLDIPKVAPRHVVANRELDKLEHYGLAERREPDDEKKRCSGIWRPTPKGIAFAHGRISVPRFYWSCRNEILEWSAEEVTVRQALGKKFDYAELMGGAPC